MFPGASRLWGDLERRSEQMRYLTFALALAFALGLIGVANACPMHAEGHSTVASADGASTPPSTPIPAPGGKSGS
jgi:hypothetical protein